MLTTSSTTILSDSASLAGGGGLGDASAAASGVTVEEVATLVISGTSGGQGSPSEGFVPKRLVVQGAWMAALSDDGRTLMLAEFRNAPRTTAPNDCWAIKAKR